MKADPDLDLVRRVARGDEVAMQTLVGQKLPRLLALAARMLGDVPEAEDIAQHLSAFGRTRHDGNPVQRALKSGYIKSPSIFATIVCATVRSDPKRTGFRMI